LLLTDGVPVKARHEAPVAPTLAATLILFFALLAVAASFTYRGPDSNTTFGFSLIIAIISFTILLTCRPWRLYRKLFSEDSQREKASLSSPKTASTGMTTQLNTTARISALPAAPGLPVTNFSPQRVNRAEMLQSPSITEHTTKLLDKE